ncbi:MAG: hypothetical protein ACREBQ_12450 [Nitrososphaerales archaeon]
MREIKERQEDKKNVEVDGHASTLPKSTSKHWDYNSTLNLDSILSDELNLDAFNTFSRIWTAEQFLNNNTRTYTHRF